MPASLVRGLPCLRHFLWPFAASFSCGRAAAKPPRTSLAAYNSVPEPSANCCNASPNSPNGSPLPTNLGPAVPPTSTRSTPSRWRYASNIRPGELATSACASLKVPIRPRCPASVLCIAGFAGCNNPCRLPGDGRRPRRSGPAWRTRAGRWTPWSSYVWGVAKESLGYGWSMSAVAPSWAPRFSPLYLWAHVASTDVQHQLRAAFSRWGLPARLRVDNGKPWGSWSDLPPALALWLIGLGIDMVWNDPRCPQQNGVVERSQGTGKRWAEPGVCRSVAELQSRLDADDRLQRERYPVARGRSRWQLFPDLAHSGRPYQEAAEARTWNLQRVRDHLAGYAVPRQVSREGKVSVYNRNLYVGVVHGGKQVSIQYDPEQEHWLISDSAGQQLRTQPAPEINAASIRNLQMMGRK
jgi:hypothetical protein